MQIKASIHIDDESVPVDVEYFAWPDQKGGLEVEPIIAGHDIEAVYLSGSDVEIDRLDADQLAEINEYIEQSETS